MNRDTMKKLLNIMKDTPITGESIAASAVLTAINVKKTMVELETGKKVIATRIDPDGSVSFLLKQC